MPILVTPKHSEEYDKPDPEGDTMRRNLFKALAHRRECCTSGHACKNAERCRSKCQACKADALEAWDAVKYKISKQADEFLAIHDVGI
jgi:hypothetical protein